MLGFVIFVVLGQIMVEVVVEILFDVEVGQYVEGGGYWDGDQYVDKVEECVEG